MTGMREAWVNGYVLSDGTVRIGCPQSAAYLLKGGLGWDGGLRKCVGPAFRIHVRLKPEGAPKRYADDAERFAWEQANRRGGTPRYA